MLFGIAKVAFYIENYNKPNCFIKFSNYWKPILNIRFRYQHRQYIALFLRS